jgi:hypothetical protein
VKGSRIAEREMHIQTLKHTQAEKRSHTPTLFFQNKENRLKRGSSAAKIK